MEYLFQTFKNPLPNMKHNYASKKATEVLSNVYSPPTLMDMMKFLLKS